MRKIIHIDMDAFYASIEQRDFPEYRNKPLAVGRAETRGVVSAASYEARRYGVYSAMPTKMAMEKCPHLILVPPRFQTYSSVSEQIMRIFLEYTDWVEPLSLDEAFLDVTQNHKGIKSAIFIAREIKQRILSETGLTASAGVSFNKFLAKIASDYQKPNGLFCILPKDAEQFVETLKVERFFGIGKVTAKKMHELGIYTGADLKKFSKTQLMLWFGKAGAAYYDNARAIDTREVISNRIRKSIGAENTFDTDLSTIDELQNELYLVALRVWERIEDKDFQGRTVTLKARYNNFEIITRSKTLPITVRDFQLFWDTALELIKQIDISQKRIRLLGLTISNTEDKELYQRFVQLKMDFKSKLQ